MSTTDESFGAWLTEKLSERKTSFAQFARDLEVSRAAVSLWAGCSRYPTWENIRSIVRYLANETQTEASLIVEIYNLKPTTKETT
tara:strand:- start:239 stop:493 length:255 start_codon:yes stop_codon:yes gene_type:complete